jgi:hypothetical protein
MSLKNLFTNTITVGRLVAISGDRTRYATVTADISVGIQRFRGGKELSEFGIADSLGKIFRLYCDESADIQKGDRLVDENKNEYKVESIITPAELGAFVHKESIIRLVK